jgi:hypothetical protein
MIGALVVQALMNAQPRPDAHDIRVDLKALRPSRACYTDAEVYTQQFEYEAVYTNRRPTKLKVRFGSEVPVGVFIARTPGDLRQRRLEDEQHWDVFFGEDGRLVGSRPELERVVDIPAGSSGASKGGMSVVVRQVPRKIPGTIDPGNYFLQLQIILQVSNARQTSRPSKQQRGKDFQWVSVLSEPAQIEVSPSPATVEDCTDQK